MFQLTGIVGAETVEFLSAKVFKENRMNSISAGKHQVLLISFYIRRKASHEYKYNKRTLSSYIINAIDTNLRLNNLLKHMSHRF